ncbi:MAG: sulfate permease [Saprospiraceae bacterium]
MIETTQARFRRGLLVRPRPYTRSDLRRDLTAGLTVGMLCVPQSMAYALLAGLPPVYGLYAALIPLILYAIFGSSPHVSIGPTALAALLCLNGLTEMGLVPQTDTFITYAVLLAFVAGVFQFLLGLFRLGALVSFLSRPVISGFTSAAAILIVMSQMKYLFGIPVARGEYFHNDSWNLLLALPQMGWRTPLISAVCLALLAALKKWRPNWPASLYVILISLPAAWLLGLDEVGVQVVGHIPSGLPKLLVPAWDTNLLKALLPAAGIIALISTVETLAIGKTFEAKHEYYRVQANRELIALGLTKMVGAVFQGFPTSASFSRSAVAEAGGARSGFVSLFAAGVILVALLLLTGIFYYLPLPALAAVIIMSVRNLFDAKEMVRLWKFDRAEFATLMATLLITVFGGLQFGIGAGLLLSLAIIILRNARPHIAELGRLPGTNYYRNIDRFVDLEVPADTLVLRFDSELNFANAEYFRDAVEARIKGRGKELRLIVLDCSSIHSLDSTGAFVLERLIGKVQAGGIAFYLSGAIGPVRDNLFRTGLMEQIGADHQFLDIPEAIRYFHDDPLRRDWSAPAVQTNHRNQ